MFWTGTERFVLFHGPVQNALFCLMDRYRNFCVWLMARNCRFQKVGIHGCQYGYHRGTGVGCAPTSLGVAFASTASGGRGARDPGVGANVTPVHFAWQVQQLEHLNRDVHGRGGTCSTCKHVGSATDSSYVA